jgi:hypothetical protein
METNTAERSSQAENIDERTKRFLHGLTELSHQCGIAITGSPTLFVMESDDHQSTYSIDRESNLSFG